MVQAKVAQKFKTSILCSINIFFFENRVVYQIMWKNTETRDSPQMTILHMCIACWTPMATDTHTEYVCINYCFSTAAMVTRTRLIVTLYVHWLYCC